MISNFPSSILRVVHVLTFMNHVSFLGRGVVVCHAKGMLFCFKGKQVRMSGFHHIDMFHTHFTHSCHEGCCIKWSMPYGFWMVYVVSLSVRVWSQSSLITVYIYVTHLTLSHFPSNLASFCFPKLCTFLLQTSSFLPCLLKPRSVQKHQPPLFVETPQPVEAPTSNAL